jgi:hypothetical protein
MYIRFFKQFFMQKLHKWHKPVSAASHNPTGKSGTSKLKTGGLSIFFLADKAAMPVRIFAP